MLASSSGVPTNKDEEAGVTGSLGMTEADVTGSL